MVCPLCKVSDKRYVSLCKVSGEWYVCSTKYQIKGMSALSKVSGKGYD